MSPVGVFATQYYRPSTPELKYIDQNITDLFTINAPDQLSKSSLRIGKDRCSWFCFNILDL